GDGIGDQEDPYPLDPDLSGAEDDSDKQSGVATGTSLSDDPAAYVPGPVSPAPAVSPQPTAPAQPVAPVQQTAFVRVDDELIPEGGVQAFENTLDTGETPESGKTPLGVPKTGGAEPRSYYPVIGITALILLITGKRLKRR
ncbi:MAG: hypothetical protein LBL26_07775, partial [Peptococcaceae bacterium]|nr:hypothetical protein [Peptococcaceae bacterium]